MRRAVMSVLGTAFAAVLVAGCSDDPEVREPDPRPTSATAEPSATPPPKPDELDDPTESGAATFALYWVNVSDYAALTGDVRELDRISDTECGACQDYIDLYRETWAAGGYFRGGEQTLDDVSVRRASDKKFFVYAQITSEDGEFRTSDTTKVKQELGRSNRVVFSTTFISGRWVMTHQALEEQE